ncbi:hypothetical protein SAMN06265379_108143 [Saccharicrinis carchari]|uniref:Uncharacterized protein n=1 Tax=Saccharicrinis carchari TaxID=1168039 RepID=A0A521EDV0_SACCC|nr:hypothetical protein SAMN06265379_108143 [Saccharicrinis carchari]
MFINAYYNPTNDLVTIGAFKHHAVGKLLKMLQLGAAELSQVHACRIWSRKVLILDGV